jgi:acyl-coenzyme A thioesterase PaaI-like protein
MTQANRLSKLVKATSKFPKGMRSTLWSKAFGRVVPMVGSAKIRYLEVTSSKVVVKIENHKAMQNHIGQVHACAMALIAETATGFVTGMNVPDSSIVLIKSLHVDFKRPSKGAMTAVATLTDEQQKLMQETDKGETLVNVIVTDESGEEPIQCEMLWAWVAKSSLKKN